MSAQKKKTVSMNTNTERTQPDNSKDIDIFDISKTIEAISKDFDLDDSSILQLTITTSDGKTETVIIDKDGIARRNKEDDTSLPTPKRILPNPRRKNTPIPHRRIPVRKRASKNTLTKERKKKNTTRHNAVTKQQKKKNG